MRITSRFVLPALLSILALLAASGPALAVGQGHHVCHDIDVQALEGYPASTPRDNGVGVLQFQSEIATGLLRGALRGELVLSSVFPDTIFSGQFLVVTAHGVLILQVSDLTFAGDDYYDFSGEFSAHGVVTSDTGGSPSTGRFEEATGEFYFHGSMEYNGAPMVFDEISGTICLEVP